MTRGYVPATVELLRAWHAAGAVPPDAERVVAEGGDEESEYAALMTAADLSTALGPDGGRRVVVVVEPAADGGLPLHTWAAVHADTADRGADADPDDDLGWFGVQEIPDLL